jgi:hypothetical protein
VCGRLLFLALKNGFFLTFCLRDYEERPELDAYDAKDVDDTNYAPTSLAARRKAEEDLLKRDKVKLRLCVCVVLMFVVLMFVM